MRVWRAAIFGALGVGLSGCGWVTPYLHEDGFAVAEIVQRVKCELAYAVPDFRGQYPSGGYQWMKYWTAKVDLTLDVNDQASVKPNASYTTPVVGGTFTIGAAGEVTSQAQRTEKLSFTVSMKELVESREQNICELPRRAGLMGNLGLEEWIISSLAPVENRQLTIGFHQPPAAKGSVVPIAGPGTGASSLKGPESRAKRLLNSAVAALQAGEANAAKAREYAQRARDSALKERFQQTYNLVERTNAYFEAATRQLDSAVDLAWKSGIADRDATTEAEKLSTADRTLQAGIAGAAKLASDAATKAKAIGADAWALLPRDTPIDSIVHTVKFMVTVGASATPNFTLVQFRGPGLTTPFASASQIRTNTLDVVLGMPANPGGKALSEEQNRQLLNIQFDQLRRTVVVPVQ
jgi:hypothetical protein